MSRAPLTPTQVIDEAARLADAEGLDAGMRGDVHLHFAKEFLFSFVGHRTQEANGRGDVCGQVLAHIIDVAGAGDVDDEIGYLLQDRG